MMKLYQLIFSIILLISNRSFSQDFEIIDTTRFQCTYNYVFLQDSNSRSSVRNQEMTLLIGARISKFSSSNELYADSLLYGNKDLEAGAGFAKIWPLLNGAPTNGLCKYKVYKNYPKKNTITFTSNLGKSFFQTQQDTEQAWTIDNKKDSTIIGYSCKQAKMRFAGRNYIAWFTLDVPVNDGPYKFGGLPGLIVKIYDTKNQHNFALARIKRINYPQPIFFKRNNFTIISPAEYVKAIQANNANLINTMQDGTKVTFSDENSKIKAVQNLKARNNFIERY